MNRRLFTTFLLGGGLLAPAYLRLFGDKQTGDFFHFPESLANTKNPDATETKEQRELSDAIAQQREIAFSDSERPTDIAKTANNQSNSPLTSANISENNNASPNQEENVASSDQTPIASTQSTNSNEVLTQKSKYFNEEFLDDVIANASEMVLLKSVLRRLKKTQSIIGFGNFNLISFDRLLDFSKRYRSIGKFTKAELAFIEKVFYFDAKSYGFMGQKISNSLTEAISTIETVKVPGTGHYLFKGESLDYYRKLKKDMGANIILTSGIRSNVKQLYLFLNKCNQSKGNMSLASRSLAPPGHSFHGAGDFDVGKVGLGYQNFTDKFAQTNEFKKMQELGYVQIRYTEDNQLGVRFEPWHIKVV